MAPALDRIAGNQYAGAINLGGSVGRIDIFAVQFGQFYLVMAPLDPTSTAIGNLPVLPDGSHWFNTAAPGGAGGAHFVKVAGAWVGKA